MQTAAHTRTRIVLLLQTPMRWSLFLMLNFALVRDIYMKADREREREGERELEKERDPHLFLMLNSIVVRHK